MELDDQITIATPEGVDLNLTLAGVGSRFVAAIVDQCIQWPTLIAVGFLLFGTHLFGAGDGPAAAVFFVVFFVVFWGYDVFFEVLASGRTPGKRWNGLRVVLVGGHPIGFMASAVRNVLRLVDWLPSFYLVGCTAIIASSRNQRLGDMAAGAIVVREVRASEATPKPPAAVELPEQYAAWDASAVTAEETGAVRRFLERRYDIAEPARTELAQTLVERLRPKVAGVPDEIGGEQFLAALWAVKRARS